MGATIPGAFSGLDDAVFGGLRARGSLTEIEDGRLPDLWKALFLATTFRPRKLRWYGAWQKAMTKNPTAFRARTRRLDSALRRKAHQFDAVLQVGGLFAPFEGGYPKPVCLLCDYTTKLAELNYPPWFGLSQGTAKRWYALETDLYRRATMILTTNENARMSFVRHYGVSPERVRTVGAGVDAVHSHPGQSYTDQSVLFVGIDFERKGGPTLLRAFAEVRKRLPASKLLIAGPHPRAPQEGVTWLGHVSDRLQVERLYADATVFVLAPICDPFPGAVREAMSHGLPVVGSRVDAMAEMITDGTNGFLVPAGNAEALADRLVHLLSSPELCRRMGEASRQRVQRQFLWTQVVNRIEDVLRQACGLGATTGPEGRHQP